MKHHVKGRVGEEAKGNRLKIGLLRLSLSRPPRRPNGPPQISTGRRSKPLFTYADGETQKEAGEGGGKSGFELIKFAHNADFVHPSAIQPVQCTSE